MHSHVIGYVGVEGERQAGRRLGDWCVADVGRDGVHRRGRGHVGEVRLGHVGLDHGELVVVGLAGLDIGVPERPLIWRDDGDVDAAVSAVLASRAVEVEASQQVEVVLGPHQVHVPLAAGGLEVHGLGAGGDDLEAEACHVVAGDQPGVVGCHRVRHTNQLVAIAGDGSDVERAHPGARVLPVPVDLEIFVGNIRAERDLGLDSSGHIAVEGDGEGHRLRADDAGARAAGGGESHIYDEGICGGYGVSKHRRVDHLSQTEVVVIIPDRRFQHHW